MKFFLAFLLVAVVAAQATPTREVKTDMMRSPVAKLGSGVLECIQSQSSELSPAAKALLQALKEYDDLVEDANDRIDACLAIVNPIKQAKCLADLSVQLNNEVYDALDKVVGALVTLVAETGSIAKGCLLPAMLRL